MFCGEQMCSGALFYVLFLAYRLYHNKYFVPSIIHNMSGIGGGIAFNKICGRVGIVDNKISFDVS